MTYYKVLKFIALVSFMLSCSNESAITSSILNSDKADPSLPYFLSSRYPLDENSTIMTGELSGELVVKDGCIRVENIASNISYLPIWPYGFHLVSQQSILQVLNDKAEVVVQVGEFLQVDGGEIPMHAVNEYNIPPNCHSPYWSIGLEIIVENP